jgi:2-phosphosulfolactate phosphatase
MQSVHVIMRKEDIDPARAGGKVVAVFDVLFATSTIVTALEHGAAEVVPTMDADAARAAAAGLSANAFLLAGERDMQPIPGFLPSVPLRLAQEPLAGKRLIYSTTNGTVALRRVEKAAVVYAASLLNGHAVARRIARQHRDEKVLLVCAGDGGAFNIEDFFGAGYVIDCLMTAEPTRWAPSDAAVAAREVYRGSAARPARCLLESRLGRIMRAMGRARRSSMPRGSAFSSAFPCCGMNVWFLRRSYLSRLYRLLRPVVGLVRRSPSCRRSSACMQQY